MNTGDSTLEYGPWGFRETRFSTKTFGKCESIMALGNGYMGLRSAVEEPYLEVTRDLLVAGTFDSVSDEVTELPNAADVTRFDIEIDGYQLNLEFGSVEGYVRELDLQTGELTRAFVWTAPHGKRVRFTFRRFVSLADLHVIGAMLEVTPLDGAIHLLVSTGIDVRMTNCGSQHFYEGARRVFDSVYIQQPTTTQESKIEVMVSTRNRLSLDGDASEIAGGIDMHRRKILNRYELDLAADRTATVEKISTVWTSRDLDTTPETLQLDSLAHLRRQSAKGYAGLQAESAAAWKERVWDRYDLDIDSDDPFDLLAARFAIYHLIAMTPSHDDRIGVAAKGLTGEGYRGHSFWDTEIFIFPVFLFCDPAQARALLGYRYRGLAGARRKAKENGYRGAMYPWEMAQPTDGEVTPYMGGVDIVTGKQSMVLTGVLEQHISADVAYAVQQYREATGDEAFMRECGYEMVIDTAIFWLSRLEWIAERSRYEINDVIGPDEYTEHANNNAYTNHMAAYNIGLAIRYVESLKGEDAALFESLSKRLDLDGFLQEAKLKLPQLYLPVPNGDGLIPQDDEYLSYPSIDLTPFKEPTKTRNCDVDVREMQISKQADVVMLLFLMEHRYPMATIERNFHYYEARTLHDSSLSLSTHAILANDLGHRDLAYALFQRASRIDLGPNMHSSNDGVHSASLGGIWQSVVFGFGGLRMVEGALHVRPNLPSAWKRLRFGIFWKGQPVSFEVTAGALRVVPGGDQAIDLVVNGQPHRIEGETTLAI